MKMKNLYLVFLYMFLFLLYSCSGIKVYDESSKQKALTSLEREMRLQNWKKALEIVNELIEFSPSDCPLHSRRLTIYSKLGMFEDAFDDIELNYPECSSDEEFLEISFNIIMDKEYDRELGYKISKSLYLLTGDKKHREIMEQSLELYCISLYRKAEENWNNQNYEGAHRYLDMIIDINPGCDYAYRFKANIYYEQENYSESLGIMEKLLAVNDENEHDLELYAGLLFLEGDYAGSLKAYEKILELYPYNTSARERYDELKIKTEKSSILDSLIKSIRFNEYVRNDELAVLVYYGLYEILSGIDLEYMIITDIDGNPYKKYIEFLVFRGVMNINQKRQFEPSKPVTKGILSSVLFNLSKACLETGPILSQPPKNRYRDISKYHIYFDIIKVMDYYGLIEPKNNSEFDITERMTVEEIIESLERFKNLINNEKEKK